MKTIKELPSVATLKHAGDKYLPLGVAREKSFKAMAEVVKELDVTRKTMNMEQIHHKEAVEAIKSDIKRVKADIDAISNRKHSIQTHFAAELSNKHSNRFNDMDAKLQFIKECIGEYNHNLSYVLLCINIIVVSP